MAEGAPGSTVERTPVTWLILGDKQGDNGQVYTIVDKLGWPCVHKHVAMRPEYVLGKPRFRATLDHLDIANCDTLEAPWPDLIITVGRRPSMVALWVRAQSGNRTRIVLVGKPTGNMPDFDLVVSSAENQLPPLDNLVPISLPLMRIDPDAVMVAANDWQQRLADYRRPLIAVLVGGETNPFKMNSSVARRLARTVRHIHDDLGGTAYVVTSRRTRPEFISALQKLLPSEAPLFIWSPGAEDNPYRALLGTADGFVVTGDSISMMVEVICLRKPLAIFPLPQGLLGSIDQLRRSLARVLFNPRCESSLDRWRHRLARVVYHLDYFKLLCSTRDFRHFHQMLVDRGMAVWDGQPFGPAPGMPESDVDVAVERIRQLFDSGVK